MIKAMLFDKDGTLLEFHRLWLEVGRLAARRCARHGAGENLEATAQQLLTLAGVEGDHVHPHGLLAAAPLDQLAECWFQALAPAISRDAFCAEVVTAFNSEVEAHPELIAPLPGIPEALSYWKQAGMKLGVATADTTTATRHTLGTAGVLPLLDFLGCSDGDIDPKPAPALLTAFCRRFQLQPAEVLVFGDTCTDMRFARNNGATGVGVLTGTGSREELAPLADIVVESVAAFDEQTLKGVTDVKRNNTEDIRI